MEDNRFIKDRKMTQKEYTAYILFQRSCIAYIEAIRFFTIMLSNDFKTINGQAIGKQRMYIDPMFIWICMNRILINYTINFGFFEIKGHIVCDCDGSIVDLPNVTWTHQEFPLGDEYLLKEKRIRARV